MNAKRSKHEKARAGQSSAGFFEAINL